MYEEEYGASGAVARHQNYFTGNEEENGASCAAARHQNYVAGNMNV